MEIIEFPIFNFNKTFDRVYEIQGKIQLCKLGFIMNQDGLK
jgi:hypothetical protein